MDNSNLKIIPFYLKSKMKDFLEIITDKSSFNYSLSQKSRAGSLESNLVKRPSIDSGINMADAFRSSSAIDNKSESSSSSAR